MHFIFSCSKFHQHFIRNFFIPKCFAELFYNNSLALKFLTKDISAKAAYKLLVKLTTSNVNMFSITLKKQSNEYFKTKPSRKSKVLNENM